MRAYATRTNVGIWGRPRDVCMTEVERLAALIIPLTERPLPPFRRPKAAGPFSTR